MPELSPLIVVAVGVVAVVGLIVGLRLHAFVALLVAAVVVSLLSPGEPAEKLERVATAFGDTAASIGIVIALASLVGKAMMDSGAADRVVRSFLGALGERRGATALMSSGFVLSVPVFFDTVFYLLVPLARSMYRRTGRHYLQYLMAISAGAAITHTLVPPTPGPMVIADNLGVELGPMLLVGVMVAVPSSLVGLAFCGWADRRMPTTPHGGDGDGAEEPEGSHPAPEQPLPPLGASLLPIGLPVAMISAHTLVSTFASAEAPRGSGGWNAALSYTHVIGDPNLALLVSAAVALWLYRTRHRCDARQLVAMMEQALMSGGVIILITCAGGAFGAMLQVAGVGPVIEQAFAGAGVTGLGMLLLGFAVASLLKAAQGSGTIAMITASAMIAAIGVDPDTLGFHPVYVATAIGSGSLVGSWMNDSGFWIYAKMGGVSEVQALKSWTPLLVLLGLTGLLTTMTLALALPMAPHSP